jgi:hypothetical protein
MILDSSGALAQALIAKLDATRPSSIDVVDIGSVLVPYDDVFQINEGGQPALRRGLETTCQILDVERMFELRPCHVHDLCLYESFLTHEDLSCNGFDRESDKIRRGGVLRSLRVRSLHLLVRPVRAEYMRRFGSRGK